MSQRRGFVITTRRDAGRRPAPDLVNRRFVAERPDQLWAADMTYVPTWAGFIYLAVVLDAWSRRMVGWSIGEHMTAERAPTALNMALAQRRPDGVIHLSDHGCQYTNAAFGKRCREMGVRPSMGSSGDAYDNEMDSSSSSVSNANCSTATASRATRKTEGRLAVFTSLEGWVQSAPAPLLARLSIAGHLRKETPRNDTDQQQTRLAHRAARLRPRRSRRRRRGQACTEVVHRLKIKRKPVHDKQSTPTSVFPSDVSTIRPVGAMMLEQNDERSLNRRYTQLEGLQSLSDTVPTRLAAVAR